MRKYNDSRPSSQQSGYIQTKVGVLPKDWDIVCLDKIVDPKAPIRYGVVQIGPDSPDGVPIVPIKFIGKAGTAGLHKTSLIIERKYAGSRIMGGDILLSVKGTIGEVGVVPEGFNGNIAREIARIRPRKKYDPQFVALQLEADYTQRRIAKKTVGSTRLEFSIHAVRDFPIAIPRCLSEQRKIAEILRTWDEAIEKLTKLRAVKEQRQRTLTYAVVFGSRQVSHFRATEEVTSFRWFALPATWNSRPIGELAQNVSDYNADGAELEVLSCSKYDGFVRSLDYFKKQVFSSDLAAYKKIWRGDFGFPSNHIEEGSIGLQDVADVGLVSPIYTVFRFAPDKIDSDYAFAVLKTGLYRHIFEVSTSSSVDRRGSLRWKEFSKLPFPVPSMAEQKAIAEVLRTTRAELEILVAEIDALTRQKRGLMQKLLTGEWRVKIKEDSP